MEDVYDIQGMTKGLHGILQMIPSSSIPLLYSALNDATKRINEPMQLAIIGKISSSKSTLVNAILGKSEIMATGQKEVTYNVGWLKYGRPDADIVIHHKDGKPNMVKSQKEFSTWSTENHHTDIDNISYIETFDDAEILKEINIIDTPGLDALRGKDSQNTLDFIRQVRPDAIIMLFTHSIAENVLDIVSKYNAGTSFNPLNAIGVLGKIDTLWQETLERDKTALQLGQKSAAKQLEKDPMLRKTLFNIYRRAFNSVPNFLKTEAELNATVEQRTYIINSIGLYGAWLIVEGIKKGEITDFQSAKQLLWEESGAKQFMKVLHNHFGMRAKLIKMESIYQNIQQAIKATRGKAKDGTTLQLLGKIEQRISDLFSNLVHEHKEYELLNQLYNGEREIGEEEKREYFALCGEQGNSAIERLGLTSTVPPQDLIEKALERERYWRKQVALEPDPEERDWMNVIMKSYQRLRLKLQTMKYQYEQAKAFLFNE